MNILFENVNAKVDRKYIFKLTIENESLYEISDDNGIRVINFAMSKTVIIKITMFQHRNIHKYIWTSPDGKTKRTIRLITPC